MAWATVDAVGFAFAKAGLGPVRQDRALEQHSLRRPSRWEPQALLTGVPWRVADLHLANSGRDESKFTI